MPKPLSTLLAIDKETFDEAGAFDPLLGTDTLLYLDPCLVRSIGEGELPGAVAKLNQRFGDIVKLLGRSANDGDVFWKEADKLLTFPGFPQLCMGYGSEGSHDRGMGPKLRAEVLRVSKAIIEAGMDDPAFFELIGLFQENVGADMISDMTAHVLTDDLVAYTERTMETLGVKCEYMEDGRVRGRVPRNPFTNKAVVLAPRNLLRDLPVAHDWSDVDIVSAHNEELRRRVNKLIGGTWRKAISLQKAQLRKVILEKPELLRDLVEQYKAKRGNPYDFGSDPSGRAQWYHLASRVAEEVPLHLQYGEGSGQGVLDVALKLCEHFKHLVEQRKWWTYLYKENGKPKHEEAAQLLFFGIADVYVQASGIDVDVSRELHVGRGAVDFKVSSGQESRALVEAKLTTNKSLVSGYQKQLTAYGKAERTQDLIYLVIDNGGPRIRVKRLRALASEQAKRGLAVPLIVEVDGTKQKSASKG